MSARWSKDLARKAALYQKSMAAVQELGRSTVKGRYEGITVTYNGFGRIEDIHADPEQCPHLFAADKLNLQYLEKGVTEAVYDAFQQMKLRKRMHWRDIDPTQDYESPDNLPPFPFDFKSLPVAPKELAVDHLPDGIYGADFQDPHIAMAEKLRQARQEAEVERQFQRALAVETALRTEAFTRKVPLEELRQRKKDALKRIKGRQARRQAMEEKAVKELEMREAKEQEQSTPQEQG
eukprot:GGOE01020385.1.p2 GENE.GGOE01020385.1~~GGOE01020385.1.p2  ORF type:complete len:243 (+),score=91.52 GGOE01020385.1:23-730(+)